MYFCHSLSVQVIQRGTRSAGYGFVSVKDIAEVEKAVEGLNKKDLDGREIIVEAAKPAEDKEKERTERRAKKRAAGRRGNKAPTGEVTEAEANGEAPESAPEAADGEKTKKKRTKKPVRPRFSHPGFPSFVRSAQTSLFHFRFQRKPKAKKTLAEGETEATPAEGEALITDAAATEGAPKKKRTKKPRTPRVPRAEGEQPEGEPSKSVVFVANLAFNVDDAALAALFKEADINVVSARVVRRRFGQPRRSKGYGFVDVGDEEQQKKALAAFEGKEVNGREIAVKIAVSGPASAGADEDEEGAPAALTEENVASVDAAEATIVAH